jgi:aryl-alcohol dehydrogenase-like predicted oxidoreductase
MNYRVLGRTGLRVPEISFGAVEIGLDYGISAGGANLRPSEDQARRLLERALELGVNFIDTARAYGDSEAFIGRALKGRRAEYLVATKVSAFDDPALTGAERERKMTESVEESLRLLQTDVVDLLMIHSAPQGVVQDRLVADVLDRLRGRGLCRFVGVSVYGAESALAAIEARVFDCLQIAYSVVDRRPESQVVPKAREAGVGLVARSVVLKGAVTPKYRFLPGGLGVLIETVKGLEARLGEWGVESLPELAYRYVLSHSEPQTALVGTAHIEELEAAVGYAAKGPLPDGVVAELSGAPLLEDDLLNPGKWPPL